MIQIQYTSECNCGGQMSATTLDLSQEAGGVVKIDLDMLGGFSVRCRECGCESYVPDVADYMEYEEECNHDRSDGEDDEDE